MQRNILAEQLTEKTIHVGTGSIFKNVKDARASGIVLLRTITNMISTTTHLGDVPTADLYTSLKVAEELILLEE